MIRSGAYRQQFRMLLGSLFERGFRPNFEVVFVTLTIPL